MGGLRELGVACSRNKKNRSELLMRKNAPLCSVVFSKSSATLTASLPKGTARLGMGGVQFDFARN